MEFSHTVDVVEHLKISPPPGSVPTTSLPLTFFDLLWLPLHSVHRVFFYEFRHSKTHFFDTILPSLKHSLSLTLQHYFPLAGKLTWPQDSPKPVILFTEGDSVPFTVAESQYDFEHLTGNDPRDVNLFYPLIPKLFNSSDVKAFPVLALQVTLFPNKGICIAVHYSHAVADGKILIHFIKSWASVCRSPGGNDTSFMTSEPLLCYDRSLVKAPDGADMALLNRANITRDSLSMSDKHIFPIEDKVLATFVIRPSDVKRMKHWVMAHLEKQKENETPLHLSTFVLTCAYVWVCLVKARWAETIGDTADDPMFEYFCFPIDCRARRKPPLPTLYFGNCLGGDLVKASIRDLIGENGIAIAAKLIGNAIQKGNDGDEMMKNMEMMRSTDFSLAVERGGLLSVAGSTKLGIYEAEFGWGSLKKAEVASIATTGAISLCECPDEAGAVEVGLARNKLQIDAFTSLFLGNLEAFPEHSEW